MSSNQKKLQFPIRGRYGKISCTLIPVSANRWRFRSITGMIRFAGTEEDPNTIGFVDPEGGPAFSIGDILHDFFPLLPYERIVSIEANKEKGLFFITETVNQKHEDPIPETETISGVPKKRSNMPRRSS